MKALFHPCLWQRVLVGMAATCMFSLSSVLACKYSVRDVAFVDLAAQRFDFLSIAEEDTLGNLKKRLHPVATAVYLDSNVRAAWVARTEAENHPAFQNGDLLNGNNRFFLFREGLDPLPMIPSAPVDSMENPALWQWLESGVDSEIRQKIMKHLLDAYAVILVVEGNQSGENQRVTEAAHKAADAIAKLIPEMPKPVDVPPQVVVLPRDLVSEESTLLWSLEMDWESADAAQAAVLIGRGRRLGPVLKADALTATQLQAILAVAGQDCECDLDRSWMQGPMIPVRWGPDRQQSAYQKLGFDPENPLVKAEISRILARGKQGIRVENQGGIGADLDMLLLGYSEEVIGAEDNIEIETLDPAGMEEAEGEKEDVEGTLVANSDSQPPADEESLSQPETSESGTTATTTVTTTTTVRSGFARVTVVLIAGFCLLALIGGGIVLAVGRRDH